MNNGWIKVYRKILDNGIMRDHTAFIIFSWLLLNVDKSGFRTIGRYQLCDELGIKPATYYKALERLEKKWGVIKTSNRIRFTEVWIVNWLKYQQADTTHSNQSINTVETDDNESNTKQEYKNKELRIESGGIVLTKNQLHTLEEEFPNIDVPRSYERFKLWQQANGKTFTNTLARFKMWLQDEKRNIKIIPKKIPEFKPNLPSPEELVSDERVQELMRQKEKLLHT